jgi:uncharacterized protein (DUF2237 family)
MMDGGQGRPNGQTNVLGGILASCSNDPVTGFFRDGCCNTGPSDQGLHTVCAVMTDEFLAYSKDAGNDLSTPMPDYGFPGLNAGDQWCLCAARWEQARAAGYAPKVRLAATNQVTLAICKLDDLIGHAIDLN